MKKAIYIFFLLCATMAMVASAQTVNFTPPFMTLAVTADGGLTYAPYIGASGIGSVSYTPPYYVPMCSPTGAPPFSQCTLNGGTASSLSGPPNSGWFQSATDTTTGIPLANNCVIGTNGSGVPSCVTTLPSGVRSTAQIWTAVQTISANGTALTLGDGTNASVLESIAGGRFVFGYDGTEALLSMPTAKSLLITNGGVGGTVALFDNAGCFGIGPSATCASDPFFVTTAGAATALSYATSTNCSSAASPAVCGSASAGAFVVAAAATTVTVNTTAVKANSDISIQADISLGSRLGVTCNASIATIINPVVSARAAGASFTVTIPGTLLTNPACYSYTILN